jgi:hypothetical protein
MALIDNSRVIITKCPNARSVSLRRLCSFLLAY